MYGSLLMAHSGWRWIVLALIVVTVVKMLLGWFGKQHWTDLDTKLLLYSRTAVYIQVVLGVILYIMFVAQGRSNVARFTAEHVVMALLAVGGVEFGAARARKAKADTDKFKFASIGFGIATVFVLVAISAALRMRGVL